MIWDCFTFYNELDLLELRLSLTEEYVDRWVIVEADKTFSGKPREFCFSEHAHRFARWQDRIIYVQVRDMPDGDDAWARERHQRDCILRGLKEAKPDDLVLISDVDELPDMPAILLGCKADTPYVLEQKVYYFFLNCRQGNWKKALICKMADLTHSPDEMRLSKGWPKIKNAGWHVSYLMDVAKIQEKIGAFSHQEYNRADILDSDHIRAAMDGKVELFKRESSKLKYLFWERLDPRIARVIKETDSPLNRLVMPPPRGLRAKINNYRRRKGKVPI